MKRYILFDSHRTNLMPFTLTRPVAAIRIGILTIAEKWQKHLNAPVSFKTEPYLSEKFTTVTGELNVFVNGSVCPTPGLVKEIESLKPGENLVKRDQLIAACMSDPAA